MFLAKSSRSQWVKGYISFLLKETVIPEQVLSGGGQLPLGGTEITSKLLKDSMANRYNLTVQISFKGHNMVSVGCSGSVLFRLPKTISKATLPF